MTPEEFQQQKADIIAQYGKPEYDMQDPVNESARKLKELAIKNLADARAKQKGSRGPYNTEKKVSVLKAIDLADVDLNGFDKLEKDILRAYFEDRTQSAKTLANRFGVPYQQVNGLMRDKRVQYLKVKYFNQTFEENTMLGLLKLTQDADPRVVLEAAKYLQILKEQEKDHTEINKISDEKLEKALRLLGDWYLGETEELVIKRSELS